MIGGSVLDAQSTRPSKDAGDIGDRAELERFLQQVAGTSLHDGPSATIESLNPNQLFDLCETLALQALDTPPVWTRHALVSKRPSPRVLAHRIGTRHFDSFPQCVMLPLDDIAALCACHGDKLYLKAFLASEAVTIGDQTAYWVRCSLFDVTTATLDWANMIYECVMPYGVLDYPDAKLIDDLDFTERNLESAARYIHRPDRSLPVLLVPKPGIPTKAKINARHFLLASALSIGGIVDAKRKWIEAVSGVELPASEIVAVLMPPEGSRAGPRLIKPLLDLKDHPYGYADGLSEALAGIVEVPPPWLSDAAYRLPDLGPAARRLERLTVGEGAILFPAPFDLARQAERYELLEKELPAFSLPDEPVPAQPQDPIAVTEVGSEKAEEPISLLELDPNGYPIRLSDIGRWAAKRFDGQLVFASRALREAKKVRHPEPARVARALELLAGPRLDMMRGTADARERFEAGLRDLHLRDGFSNAERLVGRTGDDYVIDIGGRRLLLDRHLASVSSSFNGPRMIRIYYCLDRAFRRVVVGWLPTHLMTTQS